MIKKILLKGPLLTRSGYGEQARFALRSLRSRPDLFEIYIQPIQWGQTSWVSEVDAERAWIDQRIEQTIGYLQQGGRFDISLQVTIPNEWEKIAPVNIGYTAGIETTKISPPWIEKGNLMDKIIVVSNHSKRVYEETAYEMTSEDGVNKALLRTMTDITAVNYPVKSYNTADNLELELEYDFNFLTVAQMGPRKNLFNTIKWFVEEFHDEEVGLLVKTNKAKNCVLDREFVFHDLTKFVAQFKERKCKIYLLHGDMTDEEMHGLYAHPNLHAFLTLTHGEGFGLPIFEAAYSAMPVIAPAWSGQLDFLVDEKGNSNYYDVAFDIQPIPPEVAWEGVIEKDCMWAYPREQSAKEQMRQCYDDVLSGERDARAKEFQESLMEKFAEDKMYAEFVSALIDEEEFDVESWLSGLELQEIE